MVWTLRNWPLEQIQWPVDNSERLDVDFESCSFDTGEQRKGRSPLPANERFQFDWSANPWSTAASGSGKAEEAPYEWLMPYWFMRYFEIID